MLASYVDQRIQLHESDFGRIKNLNSMGIHNFDALHIVYAERSQCDVLLTTDDRLLIAANRNAKELLVEVLNPLDWIKKVM